MIADRIVQFLKSDPEIRERWPAQLRPDTHLLDSGLIDSFGMIRLIAFLEEEFRIQLQSQDLVEENFSTLQSMENLVLRKQSNVKGHGR